MNSDLNEKTINIFPGKCVRKDLTSLIKKGSNVPTYVLEYLLGTCCTSSDESIIQAGLKKVKGILTNNYIRPDQSEYIKSKIRENGSYSIIDKVSVLFDEREDKYIAFFANLKINPFEVSAALVTHNEKLLLGGVWCIVKISYSRILDPEEEDFFDDDSMFGKKTKKKSKKKNKYLSPFHIENIRPIQMSNLNLQDIISQRQYFTTDEWIDLLIRSEGYEPTLLTRVQKFHYLLRLVPLIQKNYNLVELGPRGTGKSHIYSEISPYSILLSSGHTSVANLFYNMGRKTVGLVGNWDCIAFDEVGGVSGASYDLVQMLKNYMANGSFARGAESVNADASMAFEGNTFRSVYEMLKTTNLFEPFPEDFNNDAAFFDRIHAYLPGWETPKLTDSLITKEFGLISDFLAEFCHGMRIYDYTDNYLTYFRLNNNCNKRDDIAISKTYSGLFKLIYPDEKITKEESRELLEYAICARRRVKEQLNKMVASEFKNVDLGYIDLEKQEEVIIEVPEHQKESLVEQGLEVPGHVYSIGKSNKGFIGVYKLENSKFPGLGKLENKNIEGVSNNAIVRTSLTAAYNYFFDNSRRIIKENACDYDYKIYYNDMQDKGLSEELSVAEVVGLCSALTNRSTMPSLVIVGRVVMSGSMMPLSLKLGDILNYAISAGAQNILLPHDSKNEYLKIQSSLDKNINVFFYNTPIEAAKIALGI